MGTGLVARRRSVISIGFLYRSAIEAEAGGTLLSPRPDGSRTLTVETAPAQMTIQLLDQGSNLIV